MSVTSITLTRPISSPRRNVASATINGQLMATFPDPARADKILSVAEQNYVFTRNSVTDNSWLRIGNNSETTSGVIMDFDGTACYFSAHAKNKNLTEKRVKLYVNDSDVGDLGIFNNSEDNIINNTDIDVDFKQGDRIRLMVIDNNNTSNPLTDVTAKLTVKWRAT